MGRMVASSRCAPATGKTSVRRLVAANAMRWARRSVKLPGNPPLPAVRDAETRPAHNPGSRLLPGTRAGVHLTAAQ